jgi:hypothetical protein
MTIKILSGVYEAAYTLASPISTLSVTASGYVAQGITTASNGAYTVVNNGRVMNTNTSTPGNYSALGITGAGVVTNGGTIKSFSTIAGAGVAVTGGGKLSNQAGGLITGYIGVEVEGGAGTVINDGAIVSIAKYGVALTGGGFVTNGDASHAGALIKGGLAVDLVLGGALHNYGTIVGTGTAGVGGELKAGGLVTNGSATDTKALITADQFGVDFGTAAGTLVNFGTVRGTGTASAAAVLEDGGVVTNGSASDTAAALIGTTIGVAAVSQAAVVTNFGSIFGGYQLGGGLGANSGVYLKMGGSVTNGSASDTVARIGGLIGVVVEGAAGTVSNFATVGGASADVGVILATGGTVTNGSSTDTTAFVQGYIGVAVDANAGTVDNFGTIVAGQGPATVGSFLPGVFLDAGGAVTNGSSTDTTASIFGVAGVYGSGAAAGTVTNFGSIGGSTFGVVLLSGGKITNGSTSDIGARIVGGGAGAVIENMIGTIINLGVITGGQASSTFGAAITNGGVLTNGSTSDHTATIAGWIAGYVKGVTKLTNYGTLHGGTASGAGVELGTGASLINEASGLIDGHFGAAVSSGATATNFGLISGLGGEAVTLTDNTSRINLESGSVCEGVILANAGVIDVVSGTATASGIATSGKVEGAGTLSLVGATSTLGAGAALLVSDITVSGTATAVDVAAKIVDSRKWTQLDGTLTVAAADQMTFTGTGDTFTGTITGAGAVLFGGGSDTLDNLGLGIAHATIKNATVTLADTVTFTGILSVTTPDMIVAAGGATLAGGGVLALSNLTTNFIRGATASATLTNKDTLRGGGHLGGGSMSLVNAGTIEANGTAVLNVDTGANTVINSGLIEAVGAGHFLTVNSAIDNTGTLMSDAGVLTLAGAVSGAGEVKVVGGSVTVYGALSENVIFGSSGRLVLLQSQGFAGSVSGFSKTGTTSFDLQDINFATATRSYSGTTAAGVLTVTDGTHTAHIHLTGNYTASTWILSNDGGGGTVVVDPTAPKPAAQVIALAHAVAIFGAAGGGGTAAVPSGGPPVSLPMLASPHAVAA